MDRPSLAFIGLGVMGFPMAGHLQRAGFPVCVYNRTASKADTWQQEYGGATASTPAQATDQADIIFTCVGNDEDLRSVGLGEQGIVSTLKPGAVWVDHSTTSADIARELGQKTIDQQASFIDAPVSGGQAGADNGRLTIMCGGDQAVFDRVKPVLDTYAISVKRLGEHGAGQLTKMVNQICAIGVIQGLAEGVHFARSAGLDVEAVIGAVSQGAAQSWQMDNRAGNMNNDHYDYGFAVDWMRKDLAYVLQEARNNGSRLPVTALVDQFYSDVQAMGGGRWDTSSLLARLEQAGSTPKELEEEN